MCGVTFGLYLKAATESVGSGLHLTAVGILPRHKRRRMRARPTLHAEAKLDPLPSRVPRTDSGGTAQLSSN
jgi:hypothetical protein